MLDKIFSGQERKEALPEPVLKEIRKLIKECANYDKGNCLPRDNKCVFQIESNHRCKYFEIAVLPIKPELVEPYYKTYDETDAKLVLKQAREELLKQCQRCGKSFRPKKKESYCDLCKKIIKKEKPEKIIGGYQPESEKKQRHPPKGGSGESRSSVNTIVS